MESKILIWEKKEGVGLITLNRPERFNALNREIMLDLLQVIQEAAVDDEVRAIVITGNGKAFCSGGDLIGHISFETKEPVRRQEYIKEGGLISMALQKVPKPIIAAVNGIAAGAGMDLALACDIRIASEQARFSEVFAKAGLVPDMGGSWFLPRLVGLGKALELIFTGDIIDANEAYRIGVVNYVVPHEELLDKAMEMAGKFAKGPAQSYKFAKWAVYRALSLDLPAACEHEMFAQNLLIDTEDVQNAVQAFREKRTPEFKGK